MSQREWSLIDIPSLEGKVIVVTGGNGGLGYEAVNVFAKRGATVILASRSVERGQEAHAKIVKETPQADVEVMELDLGDLESVHNFAHAFKQKYDRLDVLLNNAGVMTTPYGKTKDGFEQQLGINHLGHFALTGLLFDHIKQTPEARIVNISSNAHKSGKVNFDNLMFEGGKGYTPMKAYGQSKLANLLFTYELQRKINDAGLTVKSVAAHPGIANTNLTRHIENKALFKVVGPLLGFMTQDSFNGALPGIRAATDQTVIGGEYFGPSGFQEFKGDPIVVLPITAAYDVMDAKTLWKKSEELTGVEFPVSEQAKEHQPN
ncbi:SDR family NAD(P)-dependent oxidoreductase [Halobacillus locisalis]|uniref:SDR family NAD(P)-dependent oxidoreductase n=1 Tax=Halobacillus locisalis TaxID=220753 RepID=A0A838CX24_9BACI|nr:oxidoreductase [Halobacillus locisalis]MBA2176597.1 SDR family NAD(P)-dependent oxidoreductase [Halobacillus locisalis]